MEACPEQIEDTEPVTVERFFARLRSDLEKRGLDYANMPAYTREGGKPDCFVTLDQFELWAAQASLIGALIPYRLDMPAEPNYCHDCRQGFKQDMERAGKCKFPNTRFERVRTSGEDPGVVEFEVIGVSRSKQVAITEAQELSLLPEV